MENDLTLRAILKTDCRTLWRWRNHPQVRRQSKQTKFVSWQQHRKWFCSKINDRKTKIYLAILDGNKIGVIRFEIEAKYVKVSVNLNPDFFGKGLGPKIIRMGTEMFLSQVRTNKSIIAEIKKQNIISQKAFSRAAYKFKEEKENNLFYEFSK
ncbi:MAG: GNAT family N-acetyltransferase [Candidatus Omnitrophota bacterium]